MKTIFEQVKINTIKELLQYLTELEQEWNNNDKNKEYLGEFLNQSLYGYVFDKEGDSYKYNGIGRSFNVSYDPCFGLMFIKDF